MSKYILAYDWDGWEKLNTYSTWEGAFRELLTHMYDNNTDYYYYHIFTEKEYKEELALQESY